MRLIKYLILLTIGAICANAQLPTVPTPEWRMTLKVVDDGGAPVAGARATVYYLVTNDFTGLTDAHGMFAASHRDKSHALGILVTKEGYYENRQKYDMGGADHYNQTKWNPSITVALRKIGNPVAMYARHL